MAHDPADVSGGAAWDRAALRDPHRVPGKAERVAAMFNAIAPTYERVNTLVSLGQDARWRRAAVAAAEVRPDDVVLDLCCGTGDMLRAFAQAGVRPRRLIGVDFARAMLVRAGRGDWAVPVALVQADALRLPLADQSVDVVSCAFGVRNFQHLQAGLLEMLRVLRPGGRAVILEFATPDNPVLRWGYRLYCEVVVPRVGALISRDRGGAYRYLPRSILTFDTRRSMVLRLEDAGFADVTSRALNLGGVVVYHGRRPPGDE